MSEAQELLPPEIAVLIPTGHIYAEDRGTVLLDSRWKTTEIGVCWENYDPNSHFAMLTRNAVHETWEQYSKIKFKNWDRCSATSEGVRIQVSDDGPHTKAVGKYLNNYPSGVVLNFTFGNWGTRCQKKPDDCARNIAVHEFGHVLGFTHEQVKANVPPECGNEPNDIIGDYLVTDYDPTSIMNLCNPTWNGDGTLSHLDKFAVSQIYGKP